MASINPTLSSGCGNVSRRSRRRAALPPNRVFYFSIPPEAIRDSIERLHEAGLIRDPRDKFFSRVVVEKPIGHDLPSAIEISNTLRRYLDESQIFRIDHYLGKETVQNLLVLRFANTIFERLWGSRNVSHVQITVAESEGLGTRAGYYDHSGAMRDMVQNHMLQVLTMLAMEPPVSLEAAAIRESKLNVLRAMRPISLEDAAQIDGSRSLRRRHARRQGGARLHARKGRGAEFEDRDLRRAQDLRRQLAMVRGAVFPAPRQTAPEAREHHRGAVPSCAEDSVQSQRQSAAQRV